MIALAVMPLAFAQLSGAKAVSVSLINQDPDPAVAGNIVEIRLGVENLGGDPANDLIIGINPAYPFSSLEGEEKVQSVGTLQGYQEEDDTKIVKFRLMVDAGAPAGSYDLDVTYYEDGSQAMVGKTFSIDVKNTDNAEIIYIDKTTLIPGQESELKFVINNVGNSPLYDLTFKWENSDNAILPVGSDNTKHIKSIPVDGSAEAAYRVIADTNVDTGLYKLNLYLTYKNSLTGATEEVQTNAGIYVGGTTDFEVAYSDSSGGETSFSIANIGSNPAYSVSVSVPQQKNWRVTGSNSVIIGNLNNGDYTLASFTLQSSQASSSGTDTQTSPVTRTSGAPRSFPNGNTSGTSSGPLTLKISYTDTMGIRQSIEKEVTVNTLSSTLATATMAANGRQQSSSASYTWPIAGLAAVILAVIAYRWHKGRRAKKDR